MIMDLASAGLREQPFGTHGEPSATLAFGSYRNGLELLEKAAEHPQGLALVQGPPLSGKSTLIRDYINRLPDDTAVAVVDGAGQGTKALFEALLRQFGFDVVFNSISELVATMRVYALQQASAHETPVVVIENAHAMKRSAFRALSELSELKVRYTSAIKFILVSDRPLRPIVESAAMGGLAQRSVEDFHLEPMTCEEATAYLHEKLAAAGSEHPEFVFPVSVCNELWQASGGWPGILDRVALLALSRAGSLPVDIAVIERPVVPSRTAHGDVNGEAKATSEAPAEPPMLYLTQNGKTVKSFPFEKSRLLVGRSEHNDISIDSRFISRHHLLLVRNGNSTFLMDLNSRNGTYVNSRRVSNLVLIDSDIISVGHHRIKFCDPHATRRGTLDKEDFADTAIMRTLDDMRTLLARDGTAEALPAPSENVPTLGN